MTDVLPGSRPATQVPEEVQPAGASIRRRRFERSLDRLFPTPVRTHSPRDSGRRWALAISDVITLAIAMFVVGAVTGQDSADSVLVLLAALPGWVLLNKLLGLYDRDASLVHKSTLDELPRVAQSVVLGAGTLFVFGPPVLGLPLDRAQIVLFCVIGLVLVAGGRSVARHLVRIRYPAERTVIVGSGEVARLVARKIHAHPEYGVNVVGFVDVSAAADGDGNSDLLGDISAFEHLCREFQAERVVIAFSSLSHEHLLDVIRVSRLLNLKISVVPRLFEMIGGSVEIDEVEGLTMLGLRGLGRTRSSLMLKRAIDLAGAGIGLLILAPLLGVIAIAIKLDSRGPVLFAQRRIGRGAEPFRMLKFRTMVRGAHQMKDDLRHLNEAELPMFKIRHDPRITRVGRFLRRMSLDELPQLVNVLRGEMSLVGPRPLIPEEDSQVIGWHRARLDLTPGLTGPWQVLGRTRIPFQEMVKLDYLYVNDWSIWNDVKLLLRTGPVVVRRSGH